MSERLTDASIAALQHNCSVYKADRDAALDELARLRAAWKIAEPHLPPEVYRRALAALNPHT